MSGAAPIRVQLRRTKGWRMPENTVSVARPGRWGNPFRPPYMMLTVAVDLFRDACNGFWNPHKLKHLSDTDFKMVDTARLTWLARIGSGFPREAIRYELAGKNLACWCPLDQPCHADVLLELANITSTADHTSTPAGAREFLKENGDG